MGGPAPGPEVVARAADWVMAIVLPAGPAGLGHVGPTHCLITEVISIANGHECSIFIFSE